MRNRDTIEMLQNCEWSASVRFTFTTGGIPIEWLGDSAEWALSYGLKPSLAETLDGIKSAGVLVVDMLVRKQGR
jgi:hypothetical protein